MSPASCHTRLHGGAAGVGTPPLQQQRQQQQQQQQQQRWMGATLDRTTLRADLGIPGDHKRTGSAVGMSDARGWDSRSASRALLRRLATPR